MTGIDLEGLQDFAAAGDREAPPYFAGRTEVLRDIEGAAGRCWNVWTKGQGKTPGATRVIYGAPGAGKSSVLMHLERGWIGSGGGAPAMLRLGAPADFVNGKTFAERLVNLLRPGQGAEIRTEISRSWNLQGSVPGVGGQLGRESRTGDPDDPINAVLTHVPGKTWTSPVVVAIDEFQAAAGDETSPHAMVLQKLHAQDYDAPIMAVLAGLSDTLSMVDRLGISRRAVRAKHSLGCLTAEEAKDLVDGWCARFGIPDGHWQSAMLEQAKEGSHWPTHVHNALAAFAEEVVRVDGAMTLVDMERVRTGAQERRQEYYEARMSDEMQLSELLLGAVVTDFRDGMHSGEVVNVISRHGRPAVDDVRRHLPKGMDAADYYRHILHRGVMQEDGMTVTTPIPSFRRWIIDNCKSGPSRDADSGSDSCAPATPFD